MGLLDPLAPSADHVICAPDTRHQRSASPFRKKVHVVGWLTFQTENAIVVVYTCDNLSLGRDSGAVALSASCPASAVRTREESHSLASTKMVRSRRGLNPSWQKGGNREDEIEFRGTPHTWTTQVVHSPLVTSHFHYVVIIVITTQ